MNPTQSLQAVVVTALALEFQSVRAHLRDVHEVTHPLGALYDIGKLNVEGQEWEIILVEAGPTNVRAASETERVLTQFSPQLAFFVGVAGGLKDVSIGDVVIANKVYGFEVGKADVQWKPRLEFGQASYKLENIARSVARQWNTVYSQKRDSSPRAPRAFIAPIASGDKVVSSVNSPIYAQLQQECSDALAVEMEGYGFLANARVHIQCDMIVVRGISDLVEGKTEADAEGSQPRAASNAAAFVIDMLAKYTQHWVSSAPVLTQQLKHQSDDWWSEVTNLMTRLYPQGPLHEGIWERAGGEVALLNVSQSGRAQWFSALRKLQQGGGGTRITPSALLQCAQSDYPSNPDILNLLKVQ